MKPHYKIMLLTAAVIVFFILNITPVYAVETTLFGDVKDDGSGCSVFSILTLVVDILSIGVGILGVIGISVAGIQYLTSSGDEQRATKAKHRIYEIVIGLAAYAMLYAIVGFLLPGGKFNDQHECGSNSNNEKSREPTIIKR